MKFFYKIFIFFSIILFTLQLEAQNNAFSVEPVYVLFADVPTGESSETVSITVKNSGYASGITVGTIAMNGSHHQHFKLSNDNCSNTSLVLNSSCTFQVQFIPQNSGIKSTVINIPYGGENLSVCLTNQEGIKHEVKKRLPPVIYNLNIPEKMTAGTSYILTWGAMGYHENYTTRIVMFDCTGKESGTCGSSYSNSEKFYESLALPPTQITEGNWTYNGQRAKNFTYTQNLNVPATRADTSNWSKNGTPIVIRFYVESLEDSEAQKSSLSLVIPGGLSNEYYDSSGRKIQKLICPATGCL